MPTSFTETNERQTTFYFLIQFPNFFGQVLHDDAVEEGAGDGDGLGMSPWTRTVQVRVKLECFLQMKKITSECTLYLTPSTDLGTWLALPTYPPTYPW